MSKKGKIAYFLISIVFFILFNSFFSDVILRNGYKLKENPVFDITLIQNQGAAFNIFEGCKIFLVVFAALAVAGIIFYTIKYIRTYSAMGLFYTSMLVAGIFNNMAERVMLGYVRDFIKLNFVDFPVFNISDIFINIGVLGIVFLILKREYCKKR